MKELLIVVRVQKKPATDSRGSRFVASALATPWEYELPCKRHVEPHDYAVCASENARLAALEFARRVAPLESAPPTLIESARAPARERSLYRDWLFIFEVAPFEVAP